MKKSQGHKKWQTSEKKVINFWKKSAKKLQTSEIKTQKCKLSDKKKQTSVKTT